MNPTSTRKLIYKSITTLVFASILNVNAYALELAPKPKANNFSTLKNYQTLTTSTSPSSQNKKKMKSKKDVIDACIGLFNIVDCLLGCL